MAVLPANRANPGTFKPYAVLVLLTIKFSVSAGDLGYLLHKNPARLHSFDLPFGKAHVFHTELGERQAQAALLLDVDPAGLVRGTGKPGAEGALDQYVNDRPYAASSFLSVALSPVFGTAMSGKSKERQELADQLLHLEASIAAVPSRGGEGMLRSLFEPHHLLTRRSHLRISALASSTGDSLRAHCRPL